MKRRVGMLALCLAGLAYAPTATPAPDATAARARGDMVPAEGAMTAPAHGMPPLAAGAVAAPEGAASADLAWSAVLMRFVDDQGRVDFRGLAADGHDLDTVVARIAAPDAVPAATDRPALLAFRINSYNALAMRHVVSRGLPRRLSLLGRLGFFVLSRVVVAGRSTSLYDYETDTIRPMDDERVHFALNCMSVSCPRLPRVPFRPEALEEALDRAAR